MLFNSRDDYFEYIHNHPEDKVVIYGAGDMGRKYYKYFEHVDYFCDQNAKKIKNIDGITCLLPEELKDIQCKMIILICVRDERVAGKIAQVLGSLNLEAEIFYFFNKGSFAEFSYSPYKRKLNLKDRLRIRIICTDGSWIIGKFARKLQEELLKLGQEVDIADEEEPKADVNHYVFYGDLARICNNHGTVRTSMVTHIDCSLKKDLLKLQTQNGVLCICMSNETVNKLSSWGIEREKLCYVNPAQDGEIKPRKIILGITNRCYYGFDLRKRDDLILEVCRHLEARFFKLKIMGAGWGEIVSQLEQLGFEVEYYAEFNREIYKTLMTSLDYWIYYGFDEGAMGYLDALAAGVKTICTPQGYHLDTGCGLTYPCSKIDDFARALKQIQEEKRKIVDAVKDWTWENYAKKHLEIWNYLTGAKTLKDLYVNQNGYMDGIFSMLLPDISEK